MIKNSLIYMLGQGLSSLISFILLPIYTRLLSPDEFGIASLLIMTIYIGTTLFSFGLNTGYMIKYFKVDDNEKRKLFSIVMILFLIVIPVIFLMLPFTTIFSSVFNFDFGGIQLLALGFAIFCGLYYQFFMSLLKVQQRAIAFILYNLGYTVCLGFLTLLLVIIYKLSYNSFLYALLLANLMFSIIGMYYFRQFFVKLKVTLEKKSIRLLFKISWPIVPSQISSSALSSADRYILNALTGAIEVGLYSVGYRFFTLIENFLLNPFFSAYNPMAYELYTKDKSAFKTVQKNYFVIYALIMALFFIIGSIFFEDLFKIIFDKRYWPAYSIIGLLALAQFFQGLSFLFNAVQTMLEKLHYSMYLISSATILNVFLNYLLIIKYGFFGAATATLISYVLIFIGSFLINQRLLFIRYPIFKLIQITSIVVITIILQNILDFDNIYFRILIKTFYASIAILVLIYLNFTVLRNELNKNMLKSMSYFIRS